MDLDDFPDFCTELREKTKIVHVESDKLISLKLTVVMTDKKLWAGVLADFYFVFQAIEGAMKEHKEHPCIAPMMTFDNSEEMRRTQAFQKDLEFFMGRNWKEQVHQSEPARKYCDRIWEVASEDPALLVAYAHSMYLALMAGGQIMKRIVKRTLGVDEAGLAIFDFQEVGKVQLKSQFKDSVNQLPLSRDQKDLIVAEKIRCFQMNNAIAQNVKATLSSYLRILKFLALLLLVICAICLLLVYRS